MQSPFCCELHFLIFGVCVTSLFVLVTILTIIAIIKEFITLLKEKENEER